MYITVKSLSQKNKVLNKKEWQLSKAPKSLRSLLIDVVTNHVSQYNARETGVTFVSFLTQGEIDVQGSTGKVGFGAIYNEQKADLEEALDAAIVAFEDGLYKVFINDVEIEQLDAPLVVQERDDIALIRFTMLAGRLW
ncbi:hypothetical protein [Paenibacillus agricola]|uniref:hypothetical protein n=1 Tax=Paenibacillus agricola TaxID=2716264 RepID=UPI002892F352|nr:hypothetical protein [Paenibacillus agricola]